MKKPKNLRLAPVIGKREARAFELSRATGEEAPDHGFTKEQAKEIAKHCRTAGVPPRKAVSILGRLMTEYLQFRDLDAFSATPAEVRKFAQKADKLAAELQSLLKPTDRAGRAIISRMGQPFLIDELASLMSKFADAAALLPSEVADVERGGWREIEAARQVALAERLLVAFETRQWPTDTGAKALPALLLALCLESVGESGKQADHTVLKAARRLKAQEPALTRTGK